MHQNTHEHTHTHFSAILSSHGTPLLFLSSCIPREYLLGMVKWSNPQEVKKAWHDVIAKWQTFDGSEKNEITSLTSWEITPSHTHIQPLVSHTTSVSVTAHMDTESWGNKYINIEIKSESKRRSTLIPPLSPSLCQRNECQDINFHDVRNLGGGVAGKSSVVADYCCLCVCVCLCACVFSAAISPPR